MGQYIPLPHPRDEYQWDARPITPLAGVISPPNIPPDEDQIFLLPVCTTRSRFYALLAALEAYNPSYGELKNSAYQERNLEHLIDVLNATHNINNPFVCGGFMIQLRLEDCQLQLYNVVGETETLLTSVDLALCTPPIAMEASAQATTLEPSEPATASVEIVGDELQFTFGIPQGAKGEDGLIGLPGLPGMDGQGIDSVEVTTLAAGSDATASLTDGVLSLGIPRGATGEAGEDGENLTPIDSVEVTTLAAGSDATASLVDGVLYLGIPRGNTGATGATGGQGLQGLQGLPGQDGEDCDCDNSGYPPYQPTPVDNNEHLCAASRSLVDRLYADFDYTLDQTLLIADGAQLGINGLWTLVDFLTLDTLPIDQMADFIFGMFELGVNNIKLSMANQDLKDSVTCALYCRVKDRGNNELTDADIEFLQDFIGGVGVLTQDMLSFDALKTFVSSMSRQKIKQLYTLYSRETSAICEALCTDCPDEEEPNGWEHVLTPADNVTTILYGFETGNSFISGCQPATWVGGGYQRPMVHLLVVPDMPEGSAITGLKIEVIGNETNLKECFIYNQYANFLVAKDEPTNYAGDHVYDFNFPELPQAGLYFYVGGIISQSSCQTQFVVNEVTLRGTGPNPFV